MPAVIRRVAPRSEFRAPSFSCGIALFLLLALASLAQAQQPAPQADPADFGLLLPGGEEGRPGDGRRVQVQDLAGEVVVAKVHAEIGDRLIVIAPNGRLLSVTAEEATPTDRPFVPATKEQMIAELTGGKFAGFKERDTKHYVYIYNTSQPFFEGASRILETMYPNLLKFCQREKLTVHEPDAPLVVIMFATDEEFSTYQPMPPGVVAYYNSVTNYVVMYEQSGESGVAPDWAIKQSISTIAHEGVHQVLHNIGVQQRLSRWPMWISEGLPEFFAPTQVGERFRWKGVGKPNDLRMHSLFERLDSPTGGTGDLVSRTVAAEGLDADGYADAWALTHYLYTFKKKNFFAYLRDVSQSGPLPLDPTPQVDLFVKHFGDDYAALGAGLVKNLKKLPYSDPVANQTHYVVAVTAGGQRVVMITTSPLEIQRFLADFPSAPYTVRPYPNRSAAEQAGNAALGN